jgi:hypothetical protein
VGDSVVKPGGIEVGLDADAVQSVAVRQVLPGDGL